MKETKKVGFMTIFSIVCLWFSTHAGGGFASGNSVTNYFAQYGWCVLIAPTITFALLGFCYRQVIVMCNNHGFVNYKDLFQELWNPLPQLEILFEIYFFVMVICAVGTSIAGAAELITEQLGINYVICILIVSVALLFLTIFGHTVIERAATAMSIVILICCFLIYFTGIHARWDVLADIISNMKSTSADGFTDHSTWKIVNGIITYAGFQCGVVPALASCGVSLKKKRHASKAMVIAGFLNAFALTLSGLTVVSFYTITKGSQIPMLKICEELGGGVFSWAYAISLFMCFVSTGVSLIYGLVPRFENIKPLKKIDNIYIRRSIVSIAGMVIPALFSLVGLTNIVKYGYQFAGLLGFAVLLLPLMIIGTYKNWKFTKKHPNGGKMEVRYKIDMGELRPEDVKEKEYLEGPEPESID